MILNRDRLGRFVLVACSALGVSCVVRTAGPSGPPPAGPYTAPPPTNPSYTAPPPAGPPAGPPVAVAPPEACPQELGADAPETPDGAPLIGVGTLRGCYGIADKRDVFMLTAPAHQGPVLYRLRITSTVEGMPCLEAKDADRARLPQLNACAKNAGAGLDAWVVVMGGTSWFLETRDVTGSSRKTERPYALDIQATPVPDVGEPDAMERPVPLVLGEATQAYMISAANTKQLDHDYFSVVVPNNLRRKMRLVIEIADVAADAHAALQVFDDTGRRIGGANAPNAGATLRTDVKMKGPGTYVFHVRNLSGNNRVVAGIDEPAIRATKPYSIRVSVD